MFRTGTTRLLGIKPLGGLRSLRTPRPFGGGRRYISEVSEKPKPTKDTTQPTKGTMASTKTRLVSWLSPLPFFFFSFFFFLFFFLFFFPLSLSLSRSLSLSLSFSLSFFPYPLSGSGFLSSHQQKKLSFASEGILALDIVEFASQPHPVHPV